MARRIEFAPDAARAFTALDAPAKQFLADALAALAGEPSPSGRRVAGGDPPAYRLRVGGARVLYEWLRGVLRVMDVRIERRVGREG